MSLVIPARSKVKHGSSSMYTYGCRCEVCKAAMRDYYQRWARARGIRTIEESRAERESPHGTASRYNNRGCRCAECTAAKADSCRDYYQRNLARPVPIPPHGTESRYNSPRARCRCNDCRDAATHARRTRRLRAKAAA